MFIQCYYPIIWYVYGFLLMSIIKLVNWVIYTHWTWKSIVPLDWNFTAQWSCIKHEPFYMVDIFDCYFVSCKLMKVMPNLWIVYFLRHDWKTTRKMLYICVQKDMFIQEATTFPFYLINWFLFCYFCNKGKIDIINLCIGTSNTWYLFTSARWKDI